MSPEQYVEYAKQLGLDVARFERDVASAQIEAAHRRRLAGGAAARRHRHARVLRERALPLGRAAVRGVQGADRRGARQGGGLAARSAAERARGPSRRRPTARARTARGRAPRPGSASGPGDTSISRPLPGPEVARARVDEDRRAAVGHQAARRGERASSDRQARAMRRAHALRIGSARARAEAVAAARGRTGRIRGVIVIADNSAARPMLGHMPSPNPPPESRPARPRASRRGAAAHRDARLPGRADPRRDRARSRCSRSRAPALAPARRAGLPARARGARAAGRSRCRPDCELVADAALGDVRGPIDTLFVAGGEGVRAALRDAG